MKLPSRKAGILRKIVTKKIEDLKVDSDPYPQHVTFSYKVLPEAHSWKPGEKYHLCLEVEQTSSNKDGASFDITKVGVEAKEGA